MHPSIFTKLTSEELADIWFYVREAIGLDGEQEELAFHCRPMPAPLTLPAGWYFELDSAHANLNTDMNREIMEKVLIDCCGGEDNRLRLFIRVVDSDEAHHHQSAAVPGVELAARWATDYPRLLLRGMTASVAAQMSPVSLAEDGTWLFQLSPGSAQLFRKEQQDRIEAAMTRFYGRQTKIVVQFETPLYPTPSALALCSTETQPLVSKLLRYIAKERLRTKALENALKRAKYMMQIHIGEINQVLPEEMALDLERMRGAVLADQADARAE